MTHTILKFFGTLLAGGLLTSLAELKFQYSLVGDIIAVFKKLKGYFSKAKAEAQVVEKKL